VPQCLPSLADCGLASSRWWLPLGDQGRWVSGRHRGIWKASKDSGGSYGSGIQKNQTGHLDPVACEVGGRMGSCRGNGGRVLIFCRGGWLLSTLLVTSLLVALDLIATTKATAVIYRVPGVK
jgi:hypothetical protein